MRVAYHGGQLTTALCEGYHWSIKKIDLPAAFGCGEFAPSVACEPVTCGHRTPHNLGFMCAASFAHALNITGCVIGCCRHPGPIVAQAGADAAAQDR